MELGWDEPDVSMSRKADPPVHHPRRALPRQPPKLRLVLVLVVLILVTLNRRPSTA